MKLRNPIMEEMVIEAASSGVTMTQFCRDAGLSRITIYQWMQADAEFKKRYEDARDVGFEKLAEDCLEIADDSSADQREGKFGPCMDSEYIARSKLRVETRLKLLACWNPRKYGQKLDVSSSDGTAKPMSLADYYAAERARSATEGTSDGD